MAKTIGQSIKSKRVKKDITRAELAKKVGISVGYMGLVENDSPVIFSAKLMDKISKVLGKVYTEKKRIKHNAKAKKIIKTYPSSKK